MPAGGGGGGGGNGGGAVGKGGRNGNTAAKAGVPAAGNPAGTGRGGVPSANPITGSPNPTRTGAGQGRVRSTVRRGR